MSSPTRPSKQNDYWSQTKTPLNCLVFLLPLLVGYELGVLYFGHHNDSGVRTGADLWVRDALLEIGLSSIFLPPLLIVAALLIWHQYLKLPWRISTDTQIGMASESLLFGLCLVVLSRLQQFLFHEWELVPAAMNFSSIEQPLARCTNYLGAGIYEEFVFRLFLLPICCLFFHSLRVRYSIAAGIAVLMTSLVFATAHYVQPGDLLDITHTLPATIAEISSTPSLWFGFVFRLLAGGFFCLLFLARGFGITVGAHVFYDIVVGVLLAYPTA